MGTRTSPRPPWILFSSQIALLYSQILFLMVIPVVLVFHYAWAHDTSYGLFVLTVSVIQGPSCKGRVNYYRRVESRGELISSVKTPSLLAIAMA
jgi:hypothetical protein